MREHFRPEFLNRIDEIVVFEPLSREQIAEIVGHQLERVRERLAERGIVLELTDAAKETLAEAGWDPAYGARPLKRAIQRMLENPLALRLLEGDIREGDTVRVDAADGELVFERVAEPRWPSQFPADLRVERRSATLHPCNGGRSAATSSNCSKGWGACCRASTLDSKRSRTFCVRRMTMSDVEPTPEDYEAARRGLERPAREVMLEILAKQEARKRVARQASERRHRLLRRLVTFGRAT